MKKFMFLGRLGLILNSLSLRVLTSLRTRSMIDLCGFVIFVEKLGILTAQLQAAKQANKQKVYVPQAQDPMVLIGESVKA